jgi:hypothetical protein
MTPSGLGGIRVVSGKHGWRDAPRHTAEANVLDVQFEELGKSVAKLRHRRHQTP